MGKKNICILGGTGFLGTQLASRLVKSGHSVTVLTRNRERCRHLLVLPTLKVVTADVYDQQALLGHFAACDTVINLVGILNQNRKQSFTKAHVELTKTILAAASQQGVRHLLQVTALKADPEKGPSEYLKTKGEAESILSEQSDVPVTLFQPSVIFGPGDSFINRFAALLFVPVLFLPNPNSRFAPVYVGDVVSAITKCVEQRELRGKTYELCGPRVMSLKEIVQFICEHLGKDVSIVGLGPGLSKLAARVLEWVPGKPMSMDNYLSMQVHSICNSNGLEQLGINATPLDSIIDHIIETPFEAGSLSDFRRKAGR